MGSVMSWYVNPILSMPIVMGVDEVAQILRGCLKYSSLLDLIIVSFALVAIRADWKINPSASNHINLQMLQAEFQWSGLTTSSRLNKNYYIINYYTWIVFNYWYICLDQNSETRDSRDMWYFVLSIGIFTSKMTV
jgi:hypothetical protein